VATYHNVSPIFGSPNSDASPTAVDESDLLRRQVASRRNGKSTPPMMARPFPDSFGKAAVEAARCAVLPQRGLRLRFFPCVFGVFSELPRLNKGAPATASPENMHP
jgi:hypothetical protein